MDYWQLLDDDVEEYHLKCINCGAVYADVWSVYESPECPYCGVCYYEETDEECRPPIKERSGNEYS